jgi:hypothetical protein
VSDTSTDKKPEDAPVEKGWTLGDGGKSAQEVGIIWFTIWMCFFAAQLCCYIKWGMIEPIGRGFIACAWLLFFWACVHVRYTQKGRLKCQPDCGYCERKR